MICGVQTPYTNPQKYITDIQPLIIFRVMIEEKHTENTPSTAKSLLHPQGLNLRTASARKAVRGKDRTCMSSALLVGIRCARKICWILRLD